MHLFSYKLQVAKHLWVVAETKKTQLASVWPGDPTWKVTQPTGRYLRSSSMLRYSATSAAECTRHCAASAWLLRSECLPAMFCSQVSRRSGEVW